MRLSFNKIVLALAFILAIRSSIQFVLETSSESLALMGLDYSQKRDYVEAKYNKYLVYRYYEWLETVLPKNTPYGILTSRKDEHLNRRYSMKLNYFLYPRYVEPNAGKVLFAPRTDTLGLRTDKRGMKYVVLGERTYALTYTKDDAGVFIRK